DAEAIAEAVQRPTMHFVAIKTPEQMDLLALHRVRSRLVGQRTGVYGPGSSRHRSGSTATCWRLRSPTSSPASPARFSRAVAPISQGWSPQMPPDESLAQVHQGDARHPSTPPSLTSWGERATAAPRGWLHVISLMSNFRKETE